MPLWPSCGQGSLLDSSNVQRGLSAELCGASGGAAGVATWQRWWILGTFSLLSVLQACTWNFYGPISVQVQALQGWTLNEIAWVENSANIAMLVAVPLSALFVQQCGCRTPTLCCGALLLFCSALRCMSSGLAVSRLGLAVAVVAMTCNGLAAAWLNFGGPVISGIWFPVAERGLATAVISASTFLGQSFGFVLGPLVVPQPGVDGSTDATAVGLQRLCYGELVMVAATLAAVAGHFPDRPAAAPSRSAEEGPSAETPTASAVGRLVFVSVVVSVPSAAFGAWVPVLTPNLAEFGITEVESAWVGCLMLLLGALGGLAFGRLSDFFPGRLKEMLLCCLSLSALCFGYFLLVVTGKLPGGALALCISGSAGAFFVSGSYPLGFELAVETGYPSIPEPIAASLLSFLQCLIQILFLAASFLGSTSSAWMNWLNVLASASLIVPLAVFQVRYPRLSVDGVALDLSRRN
ncbi:unnamed protein product [Polarella glacialis]|nr:unnamed protein product [Polarella glacialis]